MFGRQTTPPVSVRPARAATAAWDVLAVALVIGVIVVLARSSQGVLAPLETLERAPVDARGRAG